MAAIKPILKKFGGFIELGAYLLAFISVFLPFFTVKQDIGKDMEELLSRYSKNVETSKSFSYIKTYTSAGWLLAFVIISALIVAVNTFARKVVENFENDNKSNAKIIDVIIEAVPLLLIFVSLILLIISAADVSSGDEVISLMYKNVKVMYGIGFYLLLLAIISVCAHFPFLTVHSKRAGQSFG